MYRKLLILIMIIFSLPITSQNRQNIFGEYKLVTEMSHPEYIGSIKGNTYQVSYNGGAYATSTLSSGPMRAKGDKADEDNVSSDDGRVVVHYVVVSVGDVFGVDYRYKITITYNGVVIYESYVWVWDDAKNTAKSKANELANEKSQELPIGNELILIFFTFLYGIYLFFTK